MAIAIGLLSLPAGVALGIFAGRMTYKGEIPYLSALIVGMACMTGTMRLLLDIANWLR